MNWIVRTALMATALSFVSSEALACHRCCPKRCCRCSGSAGTAGTAGTTQALAGLNASTTLAASPASAADWAKVTAAKFGSSGGVAESPTAPESDNLTKSWANLREVLKREKYKTVKESLSKEVQDKLGS